jgi:hypothetical protein
MPSACLRTTGIKKVGIISVFVVLICILGTTKAVSETQLPNVIKLGVRTTIPAIAKSERVAGGKEVFSGFCHEFGQKLEQELQKNNSNTTVLLLPVKNEYLDPVKFPRWGSLTTDKPEHMRDLQCGPNSIPSANSESFIFSDLNFYETGIKLLIKKKTLGDYNINQDISLSELLKIIVRDKLRIGALNGTTTLERLKQYEHKGYNTRDDALHKLGLGKEIQAFASDGIILRDLMERGDGSGAPYKDMDYVIIPEGANYLAGKTEKYAIAISTASNNRKNILYSSELLKATNNVLNPGKFSTDERKKLEQYEMGEVKIPWDKILIGIAGLAFLGIIILFLIKHFIASRMPTSSPVNFTIHINMNQDMAKVIPQIQELVEELKKQGLTTEVAKEKVAKDIATQAQSDPTKKENLIKWGQALTDKTVSTVVTDVGKEIIKSAIRLTGFPLP